MDVYDEVDRRENDSVWLSTHDHTSIVSDRQAVPFLPVNPEFSATRNQVCQYIRYLNYRCIKEDVSNFSYSIKFSIC